MGPLQTLIDVDTLAGEELEAGRTASVWETARGWGGEVEGRLGAREAAPDVDTLQRRPARVQALGTLVNVCGRRGVWVSRVGLG